MKLRDNQLDNHTTKVKYFDDQTNINSKKWNTDRKKKLEYNNNCIRRLDIILAENC